MSGISVTVFIVVIQYTLVDRDSWRYFHLLKSHNSQPYQSAKLAYVCSYNAITYIWS